MSDSPSAFSSRRIAAFVALTMAAVLGFSFFAASVGATPEWNVCYEQTHDFDYCEQHYTEFTTTTRAVTTSWTPTTEQPTTTAPTTTDTATTTAPTTTAPSTAVSTTSRAPSAPSTTTAGAVTTTAPDTPVVVTPEVERETMQRLGRDDVSGSTPVTTSATHELAVTGATPNAALGVALIAAGAGLALLGMLRRRS